MALINSLHKAKSHMIRKNWDKIYIAVDIHDVIVHGNYKPNEIPTEYLDGAKETLQMLSEHKKVCLILFSCSHPHELVQYDEFFKSDSIYFEYINENPEVPNNALGCYDSKLYFNVYLEDKCGFIESDWETVFDFFTTTLISD